MVYETDFYTTRRPYSRPTISSYSVTTHYMKPYLDLNKETWEMNYIKDHQEIIHAKSTLKKPNPYLIKEESPDRENIDREKSRMTVRKIKKLRQKVREGAAKCEMISTRGYDFKNPVIKMPKIKMLCLDTPLRVIPGVGRVYSPNLFSYSSYVSTPYRHYTPISTYSYHYPSYSYDYSLPGSFYLPSAVPIRYFSRSSPVRVITSPLSDYDSPRIYSVNVRPSVIHRELLRIEHKTRPRYGYDPTEEYLNTASSKEFEDDIRSIRTQTARVLSRIHAPLPRARRAISCTPFSSYTDRDFYDRIRGKSSVRDDIFTLANYAEPARHFTGKSHLASVRIYGNKGYPVRKPAYTDDIYDPAKVHNEVQYLSYYLKNRRAAAENENRAPKLDSVRGLDPHRPSRKFTVPKPLEDPNIELKAKQAERAKKLASLNEVDEIELEKIRAKRLDEQKLKAEKMAADAKLKQEEEAQKIEAARKEAARKLEEERKQQEAKRLEEERLKAEAAKAKEAQELASKKAADEQAKAEAERLAAEKAKLEEEAAKAEAERLAADAAAKAKAEKEAAEKAKAEAARLAAEAAEKERLAKEEEAKRLAEEAAEKERLEQERIAKEEEEKKRLAEEQARLEEEAAKLAEFEKVAKEEREAELARQAAELGEIARLEAEALKLEQLEQEQAVENSQSEHLDNQIQSEPVVEEPLTPAAVEDTKEDLSEAHATAEDPHESEHAQDTADEADPLDN